MPFRYESTGVETFFRDQRDPHPRPRRVFSFHRPETLLEWLKDPKTLRTRLGEMGFAHALNVDGMRDCQIEAVTGLEQSLAEDRPRALIQMATGAGKTFTACAFTYRLIKFAKAKRVLFLVDRANLGRQAKTEFDQFVLPEDGRKFTSVYNVQHLASNKLDEVCSVTICTIQRLYSMLRGEMKGRGTRVLPPTELKAVSGEEARAKTHFVIVNWQGLYFCNQAQRAGAAVHVTHHGCRQPNRRVTRNRFFRFDQFHRLRELRRYAATKRTPVD
jgi:type I site-specific restriction endonuclease